MVEENKLDQIKQMIETAYDALAHAKGLLGEIENSQERKNKHDLEEVRDHSSAELVKESGQENSRVIEGTFDGLDMIGPDGKQYSVPQNYASKSKLVEGDRLKLNIDESGSFVYKQIGPVDRKRLIGILTKNGDSEEFRVLAQSRSFKVLLASVTYFRGEVGDEVVILVPRDREAKWAAVENIIKGIKNGEAVQETEEMQSGMESTHAQAGENIVADSDSLKINEFSPAGEEIDKIEEI